MGNDVSNEQAADAVESRPARRPGPLSRWWSRVSSRQLQKAHAREIGRFMTGRYAEPMARSARYCQLAQAFEGSLTKGDHVLELGCGPGKYVAMLSSLGYRVTGADPHRFPEWERIGTMPGVALEDSVFAERLPYADNQFNGAACLGALLYFQDPDRAMEEIARVVKPGGPIVMRTVNRLNRYTQRTGKRLDPASRNLYTMQELVALLEKHGLTVQQQFSYGYWPARWSNFWWYLANVWLPEWMHDRLSNRTPESQRVNLIVFARNRS